MSRSVQQRYDDPLDVIWVAAARALGIAIVRSEEVFASYDGAGTLTLCTAAHFDADDCLAQLIFHELCHALVCGDAAFGRVDWGMENVDARDLLQEHACHRLQARLADDYGLRGLFAVTTDHRVYWDALPIDPLGPSEDPATPLARAAYERATRGPWADALREALSATQALAKLVRPGASKDSLWARVQDMHAAGFPIPREPVGRCGQCSWAYGPLARLRCRQTKRPGRSGKRVAAELPGCVRFEAKLDTEACGDCGACCREAFDLVQVGKREPFAVQHPELTASDAWGLHVPRPGGRCGALAGDGTGEAYRCRHYDVRPRSCRDFEVAGDACLSARRVLGLSA